MANKIAYLRQIWSASSLVFSRHSKECFGCFTCVNNMYNPNLCPPINNEKLRQKYEKGTWYI